MEFASALIPSKGNQMKMREIQQLLAKDSMSALLGNTYNSLFVYDNFVSVVTQIVRTRLQYP